MNQEYITLAACLEKDISKLSELTDHLTSSASLGILNKHYISTTFDNTTGDVSTIHAVINLSVPLLRYIPYRVKVLALDISVNGYPIYDVADRTTGHRSCSHIAYNNGVMVFSPDVSRGDLKNYFQKIDPKIYVLAKRIKETFHLEDFRFVKK